MYESIILKTRKFILWVVLFRIWIFLFNDDSENKYKSRKVYNHRYWNHASAEDSWEHVFRARKGTSSLPFWREEVSFFRLLELSFRSLAKGAFSKPLVLMSSLSRGFVRFAVFVCLSSSASRIASTLFKQRLAWMNTREAWTNKTTNINTKVARINTRHNCKINKHKNRMN